MKFNYLDIEQPAEKINRHGLLNVSDWCACTITGMVRPNYFLSGKNPCVIEILSHQSKLYFMNFKTRRAH